MNIYTIEFSGHYPVGAVALVFAHTQERAVQVFLNQIKEEEPDLYESCKHQAERGLEVRLHHPEIPRCVILLNGNY
jgi:hypothetical protein